MSVYMSGGKICTSGGKSVATNVVFDFYISTSGSDSNPGTLVSPWAITSLSLTSHNANNIANCLSTSGKRVGIIEGTYNVSGIIPGDKVVGPLDFVGGSVGASTYIASCDTNGVYKARAAIITAKNGGGQYYNGLTGLPNATGPVIGHDGTYPQTYTVGYLTIDGLKVTGFTYKAIRIGNRSSGDGPAQLLGIRVVNCELYDGDATGLATDNVCALWLDNSVGAYVGNNYIHDVIGPGGALSADHTNSIIVWGERISGPPTSGAIIEYNTSVRAGNIYGKELGIAGIDIRFNYTDGSSYTSNFYGTQDWTGYASAGLTGTTKIHENIFVGPGRGLAIYPTLTFSGGTTTAFELYNNTIVMASGATIFEYIHVNALSAADGLLKCYNNIATGPVDGSGRKSFVVNAHAIGVWDYNMWLPSGMTWSVTPDTLGDVQDPFTTLAGFQAKIVTNGGIANVDSHGVGATPSFISTTGSTPYKLTAGTAGSASGSSPGSTNGTTGGSACDMGAWGLGATRIGCNF